VTRHAVAFAEIKALDSEQRIVEGWASRVEVDRQGDIVEARGLQPPRGKINLLLDHNHSNAVGVVEDLKASDEGVRFRARLAKIAQPGALKELCDDAWQMVVGGLRSAVSIGFKPIDMEPMANGGMRFRKWEILELSLVAVPACAGATIDTIKSLDRQLLRKASKGRVVRLDEPLTDRTGKILWQPKKAAHRVIKLDMPGTARGETGGVMRAAEAAMDEMFEAQRLAAMAKKAGPEALPIRMIGEAARETDRALAELRARLAKLETRNGR
jgi:HK97 family phage prohead protease